MERGQTIQTLKRTKPFNREEKQTNTQTEREMWHHANKGQKGRGWTSLRTKIRISDTVFPGTKWWWLTIIWKTVHRIQIKPHQNVAPLQGSCIVLKTVFMNTVHSQRQNISASFQCKWKWLTGSTTDIRTKPDTEISVYFLPLLPFWHVRKLWRCEMIILSFCLHWPF